MTDMNTEIQAAEDAKRPVDVLVSEQHIGLIEHSLGNKTHYRNYFLAGDGHHDQPMLEELVELGLMTKRPAPERSCGDTLYHVTDEGKKLAFAH